MEPTPDEVRSALADAAGGLAATSDQRRAMVLLSACEHLVRRGPAAPRPVWLDDAIATYARDAHDVVLSACALHLLVAIGRWPEALALGESLPRDGASPEVAHVQVMVDAVLGRRGDATESAHRLQERVSPNDDEALLAVAFVWRLLGDALAEVALRERLARTGRTGDADERARRRAELSHALLASRDAARVVSLWRGATDLGGATAIVAAEHLVAADAPEDAEALLRSALSSEPSDALRLASAELALWRGDAAGAEAYAARITEPTAEAHRVRGAAAVLAGRHAEAALHLDRAVARAPRDAATFFWRGEARLRAGDARGALADVERGMVLPGRLVSAPGRLLRALARLAVAPSATLRAARRGHRHDDGMAGEHLAVAHGEDAVRRALRSVTAYRELLWRSLDAFGARRTSSLRLAPGAARPGDARSLDSREASVDALSALGTVSAREVLARLDALATEFPRSPQPLTHRGELHLWCGDYDAATRAFEVAHRREPCRWDYVGRGAAASMRGHHVRALAIFFVGGLRFGDVEGATTPAYRGEALRRLGRNAAAARELRRAVAERPTRVSAWMNLALCTRRTESDAAWAEVLRAAPAIVHEAMRLEGAGADRRSIAERALRLMCGNRSSRTQTIVIDGALRVLPPIDPWSNHARTTLRTLRRALLSRANATRDR